MTLRHLRIFVAVCETGSMTAAASQLFIAQPSISLAVSEMEEYYGVKPVSYTHLEAVVGRNKVE